MTGATAGAPGRRAGWPGGPAWLFCPADRPERFTTAAAHADVVILDLEDGVAPADRPAARAALAAIRLDPARTVVRINPAGTAEYDLDLDALAATSYRTVMLAKTTSADDVRALTPRPVIALCETPAGVLAAAAIAATANVAGLMWGAEDLVAATGGRSSRRPDGTYRDVARYARVTVLLAAAAAGLPAIDAVHLDLAAADRLAEEAADAVACGFAATACIHPAQVEVVRRAYRPSAEELDRAQAVLAAAAGQRGAFAFDGRMVDDVVLRQAHAVVAAARLAPAPGAA